ncbi:MAG TPA: hypothetical protein VNH18_15910 [Bryobacteraceae bacterium]|nr:hypothetical protein [Bryobacteraceae bacterium]
MPEWRYWGRTVTTEEIYFIRRLVAEHPAASGRRLSGETLRKQANGVLREMFCHGLLLMLPRDHMRQFASLLRIRPKTEG